MIFFYFLNIYIFASFFFSNMYITSDTIKQINDDISVGSNRLTVPLNSYSICSNETKSYVRNPSIPGKS